VHVLSHGVPRRINLLCDRALLGAYAAGAREVSVPIVNRAAREVFDAPAAAAAARSDRGPMPGWALAGLGGVAGATLVAAAGWALGMWPPSAGTGMGAGHQAGGAAVVAPAPSAGPRQAAASRAATAAAGGAVIPAASAASPATAESVATAAPTLAPALQQFLAAQSAGDAPAWKSLASAWGVTLAEGTDACATLPRDGLRCYRNRRAGLNLVRQIDRPVMLTLFPSEDADESVSAVLRSLDGDTATLQGNGQTLQVPVAALAQVWRGDMATLWRTPPGMPERGEIVDSPDGAAWLDKHLASSAAGGTGPSSRPMTPALRQSRIHRFQLAQGVTPDGRAGPLTLMLLNRATGVNEPRLHKAL
jgi:general secretion pathway protein A